MKKRRKRTAKDRKLRIFLYVLFTILLVLSVTCTAKCPGGVDYPADAVSPHEEIPCVSDGDMVIHIIDVGQGDCALIQGGGANILVDAGENGMGFTVLKYLKKIGVDRLDMVIGSHGHSDHIGGLDTVIDSVKVEELVLPDVPEQLTQTTKTYSDLLDAAIDNKVPLTKAGAGDKFTFGAMQISVISPNRNAPYDDLNDFSLVLRFEVTGFSYLTGGDITSRAENDIVFSGADIGADVLKLPHHGSYYSSSWTFLKRCSPKYAVIMVGRDNEYGHPHDVVMDRLSELDITPVRTDRLGDIVIKYSGGKIDVSAA